MNRRPILRDPKPERALETLYDRIWEDGRAALARGTHAVEPLPVVGQDRWGVSVVLRPASWHAALAGCTTTLVSRVGPDGFVYGRDNLHVTLRSFEAYRDAIPAADASLRTYVGALAALARRHRPMRLRLRGLTASPAGVLVQGWPEADVQAFRLALHGLLAASGLPLRGPEADPAAIRTTAHATVALYGETLDDAGALAAFVDAHRKTDFGEHVFDTLWLVGYRRTRTTVTLVVHDRFEFSGIV